MPFVRPARRRLLAAAAMLVLASSGGAFAQTAWPDKPGSVNANGGRLTEPRMRSTAARNSRTCAALMNMLPAAIGSSLNVGRGRYVNP